MLRSLSGQKAHYRAPNGSSHPNQTICGRAPSRSGLNPQRWIIRGNWGVQGWGGGEGGPCPADAWLHLQTRGRSSHYHQLSKMNNNLSHRRLAALRDGGKELISVCIAMWVWKIQQQFTNVKIRFSKCKLITWCWRNEKAGLNRESGAAPGHCEHFPRHHHSETKVNDAVINCHT